MNKKILNTTSICLSLISFSIVTTLPLFTSSPSAAAAKKTSKELSWEEFRAQFNKAFETGNVKKLEQLRAQRGFGNINDLAGHFMKYGAGMDQWPQLIADAKKNGKK